MCMAQNAPFDVLSGSSPGAPRVHWSVHPHPLAAVLRAGAWCRKGMEVLCRLEARVHKQSAKQPAGMASEWRISWRISRSKVARKREGNVV